MDLNYEMMYIVKPAEQEISKQVNAKLDFDSTRKTETTIDPNKVIVSQDTLKPVNVILPNDDKVITSFNQKIDVLFEKIDELNLESHKLKCLLDYLTPLLINGQVVLDK